MAALVNSRRAALSFLALSLLAAPLPAAEVAKEAGPQVVLTVGGGLRRAPETGGPSFVLYGDRNVIFQTRREGASASGYLSTRLTEAKYRALLEAISPQALLKLGESYDAIVATDPSVYTIHAWPQGKRKSVSVTGMLLGGLDSPRVRAEYPADFLESYDRARAKSPREFIRAFDAISLFDAPAAAWLPPTFEVLLWRDQKPREAPLYWPQGWPGLATARDDGRGRRTLLLPAAQFATLKRLLRPDARTDVVSVEGGYWRLGYRLPFPHEQSWAK